MMKTMSSCPEYSRFSALPLEGVIMTEYEYSETYFLSLADFWTRRSYPLITSLLDSRLKSKVLNPNSPQRWIWVAAMAFTEKFFTDMQNR